MIKPRSWGEHRKEKLCCLEYSTVAWEIWALFWQTYFNYLLLFPAPFRVALPLPSSPTSSPGISLPKLSDLFKHCDISEVIHEDPCNFIFLSFESSQGYFSNLVLSAKNPGKMFCFFSARLSQDVNTRKKVQIQKVCSWIVNCHKQEKNQARSSNNTTGHTKLCTKNKLKSYLFMLM